MGGGTKTKGRTSKERGVHVALLRGINVGGRNKLPMKELAAIFADAGCTEVRTYIQSGNVVFRARPSVAKGIGDFVAKRILKRFGYRVPVVLRTANELRKVAERNPFFGPHVDTKLLHVVFLVSRPGPAKVAGLDPDRSPPDEFALRGREIYLRCPNGMARTKLTNQYFDSRLATTSTVRSWATVLELLELAGGSTR